MQPRAKPVLYNWPLDERAQHFELGAMLRCDFAVAGSVGAADGLVGWWECDLVDNRLSWSNAVYDIFGLPHGAGVTRGDALACYAEHSRVILERLRADAIRSHCGFTLDAELRPQDGRQRWVRLTAAPDVEGGKVVRLHGLKLSI